MSRLRRGGRRLAWRFLHDDALHGQLRLWSGVLLFAFALTHLANHALGLVSLQAAEAARLYFVGFWRIPVIELSLALAGLVHVLFALVRLWRRRGLRMPAVEWLQIGLGLAIPFWLTIHVLATALVSRVNGTDDTYTYYLSLIWPGGMQLMTTLVVLVWLHGCIGIWRRLRLTRWGRRYRSLLLAGAVLVPVLALLGTISAGREYGALKAADSAALAEVARRQNWPDEATRNRLVYRPERLILAGAVIVLVLLVAARGVRWAVEIGTSRVRVTYDEGPTVRGAKGMTLLEMSRIAGVPHAGVCGGRGRCSTCRVRILDSAAHLLPPSPAEVRVLQRIKASPDVRLACQLRPTHALRVARLVSATAGPPEALRPLQPGQGREAELAVLFADLRDFTRLAEGRLPFDTVYLLNRYFRGMGQAIEAAGGHVDKFIGDGVMALFGIDHAPDRAARQALAAARAMAGRLEELNAELKGDLREPLRIGIGLHQGPVIVGEMGFGRAVSVTAIGDTVNVASRLEASSKMLGVQLVVSKSLVDRAAVQLPSVQTTAVELRGRVDHIDVFALPDARDLPPFPTLGEEAQDYLVVRLRRWAERRRRPFG